jgi:hypothetical protein
MKNVCNKSFWSIQRFDLPFLEATDSMRSGKKALERKKCLKPLTSLGTQSI